MQIEEELKEYSIFEKIDFINKFKDNIKEILYFLCSLIPLVLNFYCFCPKAIS